MFLKTGFQQNFRTKMIFFTIFLQIVASINDTDPDFWKSLDAFRLTDDMNDGLKTVRYTVFQWSPSIVLIAPNEKRFDGFTGSR